jgi:uncharacterized PurR-regulated membrane protein YhhQ (DUF165 family)
MILIYLLAIVIANLTVTYFGSGAIIINSFLFIGLDLTARDHLHERWRNKNLFLKMILLIATGSILSYFLNKNSANIAMASFAAFACAGVADSVIYRLLDSNARLLKINGSNVAAALVDSMIFPVLAFGLPVMWGVVFLQFTSKFLGGFFWSFIILRIHR